MFEISRRRAPGCATSRRDFFRITALGAAGLGLLPSLRAAQAAGELPGGKKAVILFWLAGGPSHLDMYDLKPKQPIEVRGPFAPIATNLPGLEVCDQLPRHAAIADKLAVIRSFTHTYGVHDDAQHLVQTGYANLNARVNGQRYPSQGSVLSYLRGANQPGMPPYVCLPEDYRTHAGFYQDSAFLGPKHRALNGGGDPAYGNYRPPEFMLPQELSLPRLAGREKLWKALDAWQTQVEEAAVRDADAVQSRAFELLTSERIRAAFDLTREPEALRDRYGKHFLGQSALLARRLVEAGATFVTINSYEKDVDWWDDHYTIERNLRKRLPLYDQALCTLLEDLSARGNLDHVLVVACGEFGRAPRIDSNAGRGHWPFAMTAILAGGGIRAGQIIGATTSDGGEPADRPLHPGDLLASIYRVMGVDPETTLTDRQDRPVRLVEQGTPIEALF